MKKQLFSLLLIAIASLAIVAINHAPALAASGSSSLASQIEGIADDTSLPINTPMRVFMFTMVWILEIFTILAVLAFIVSGITYLFAGSSKDLADQAKNGVKYAIMGIVVALSAYIVIQLIYYLLAGQVVEV